MHISFPYIAGLFDGEGSLGIYKYAKGGYQFRVSITAAEVNGKQLLDSIKDKFGGYVYEPKNRTKGGKLAYQWRVTGESAVHFLYDIYPFLNIKNAQCDVLFRAWEKYTAVRWDKNGAQEVIRNEMDLLKTMKRQ